MLHLTLPLNLIIPLPQKKARESLPEQMLNYHVTYITYRYSNFIKANG